jgi:hypothetical protein
MLEPQCQRTMAAHAFHILYNLLTRHEEISYGRQGDDFPSRLSRRCRLSRRLWEEDEEFSIETPLLLRFMISAALNHLLNQ